MKNDNIFRKKMFFSVWSLPSAEARSYNLSVVLPSNMECEHCLLQWTWRTANSWGVCEDGTGAMGCGQQETYRACSDVRIMEEEASTQLIPRHLTEKLRNPDMKSNTTRS